MARGVRLSARGWLALAVLLATAALALRAGPVPVGAWDWQPGLAAGQPWRLWTAAFVHWSVQHLVADLAGCVVVAAFGVAARCGAADTLAWALAWPVTHAMLLAEPALAHYGGLSGVLHAGVAVAAAALLRQSPPRRRIGAWVLVGLAAKVLLEQPWRGPLQHWPGWNIAIAPLAHATGALAGLSAAALVEVVGSSRKTMAA